MKITPDETYQKIWEYVRTHNRMPTIRELAEFCDVHFMTISRRIKDLKEDGRIETRPRAGIYFPAPKVNKEEEQ